MIQRKKSVFPGFGNASAFPKHKKFPKFPGFEIIEDNFKT